MKRALCILTLVLMLPAVSARASDELTFDFAKTTPVGSWQVREQTTTDHKGKQKLSVVKSSVVGTETRNGEEYYWIESEVTNYKLKKGKRKQDGKRTIVKALVKASALEGDLANAVNNLSAFGEEIIMQTGDNDPIKLSGAGSLAQGMMKALGVKVNYDFEAQGEEEIEVPAGSFDCRKIAGKGSTETKVVFKKIKVESESVIWIGKVPFGVAKMISDDVINGKQQHSEAVVIEYGTSGAETQITKEPKEMPNLFGG
jgi:hypothetical protein